jgi:hypothetical protein
MVVNTTFTSSLQQLAHCRDPASNHKVKIYALIRCFSLWLQVDLGQTFDSLCGGNPPDMSLMLGIHSSIMKHILGTRVPHKLSDPEDLWGCNPELKNHWIFTREKRVRMSFRRLENAKTHVLLLENLVRLKISRARMQYMTEIASLYLVKPSTVLSVLNASA